MMIINNHNNMILSYHHNFNQMRNRNSYLREYDNNKIYYEKFEKLVKDNLPIFDKTKSNNNSNTYNITQTGVILIRDKNHNSNDITKIHPRNLEILLVKQKASNKWGLPKGHLNENEQENRHFYYCATRELEEESGIKNDKYKKIATIKLSNKLFYYAALFTKDYRHAEVDVNPIDKDEISDHYWMSIFELREFIKENHCNRTIKNLHNVIMYNTSKIIKNNIDNEYIDYFKEIYDFNQYKKRIYVDVTGQQLQL